MWRASAALVAALAVGAAGTDGVDQKPPPPGPEKPPEKAVRLDKREYLPIRSVAYDAVKGVVRVEVVAPTTGWKVAVVPAVYDEPPVKWWLVEVVARRPHPEAQPLGRETPHTVEFSPGEFRDKPDAKPRSVWGTEGIQVSGEVERNGKSEVWSIRLGRPAFQKGKE